MRNQILIFVAVLGYLKVLHWSYTRLVSPGFGYLGYVYAPPLSYLYLAFVMALLPAFWMPMELKRPSQVAYWILYITVYIPSTVIPFCTVAMNPDELLLLDAVLLFCFGVLGAVYNLRLGQFTSPPIRPTAFWLVLGGVIVLAYGYILSIFGMRSNVVSLLDVYDVRLEYKEIVGESGRLVDYLVGWLNNAVNPLLIAYGMVRKRVLPIVAGLGGQYVIYSITGYKSAFFSGFFLIGLLILMRGSLRRFGVRLMVYTTVLVLAGSLWDLWSGSLGFTSLITRRTLVTPGLLTGYYYEFFSHNPLALLGDSLFSSFVLYQYPFSIPTLIGYSYYGDPNTHANANLWANAFANFGFAGMIGYSVILAGIFWVYDSIAAKRSFRISSLLLGIPAITLSNSALFTSLLTHGIALLVILLYIMPIKTTDGGEAAKT